MSRTNRLVVVLGLNLAPVAALIVVGVTAHSVGVFAAGGDYLLDAAGIGVALIALALSRHSGTARRPGGFPNALNIAAVVNAGWLLVLDNADEGIGRMAAALRERRPKESLTDAVVRAIEEDLDRFAGVDLLRSRPDCCDHRFRERLRSFYSIGNPLPAYMAAGAG